MKSIKSISRDLASLPPEAQREAADFIAFLRQRYERPQPDQEQFVEKSIEGGFIGMWREGVDSAAWLNKSSSTRIF